MPLGNVILDEQKVRRWLTKKRYASGASMSVDEVAKRLGLKQQVVYDLVKLGLLATIQDERLGRRVTQASLEDFRTNHLVSGICQVVKSSAAMAIADTACNANFGTDDRWSSAVFF